MAFPEEFLPRTPPPAPAGPIGQGYLTPFGETTPQLFQNVGSAIGGFGGTYNKAVYDSFMSRAGDFIKPGGTTNNRDLFKPPAWDSTNPQPYEDFWKKLVASGSLSPQGLYFLLGLSRSPHNVPPPQPRLPSFPTLG